MALNKELINDIITVTSKAAISCYEFIGKNKKKEADKSATDSMRNEINKLSINGEVVIGEGELDNDPMLYIGEKDNESLVFHNIWGIRTKDKMKRKIIGKAVITTLNPGKELAEVDKSFNFLSRIKGMTLLTPRY